VVVIVIPPTMLLNYPGAGVTPLWRSTIGFDRLFDLLDESARWVGEDNYPPYNIERTGEHHYGISLALAGFNPEEITITAEQNVLSAIFPPFSVLIRISVMKSPPTADGASRY
jgi:hypothetical protein